jgi:hypothetical protein
MYNEATWIEFLMADDPNCSASEARRLYQSMSESYKKQLLPRLEEWLER